MNGPKSEAYVKTCRKCGNRSPILEERLTIKRCFFLNREATQPLSEKDSFRVVCDCGNAAHIYFSDTIDEAVKVWNGANW